MGRAEHEGAGGSHAGLRVATVHPVRDAPDPIDRAAVRRPLTDAEVRDLETGLREAERRQRAAPKAALVVGAAVIAVLWALTLLASDAPAAVVTGFWLVAGGGIILWVRRDLTRDVAGTAEPLRSALRRREADAFRVEATAFAEFDEVEDEGAAYAFQVTPGRLLFVTGQEFYATADFPALAFSLVYPLTEGGAAADMWIASEGPRARPDRVVSREVKLASTDFPEHLEVRAGTIDDIERALGRAGDAEAEGGG